MLQPSSQPPYSLLVTRIVRHSDQQASIFLQQKIKACGANSQTDLEEKSKIISAILEKPFEMMVSALVRTMHLEPFANELLV